MEQKTKSSGEYTCCWHARDASEILRLLETSENGISQQEARRRLKQQGYNRLPRANKRNVIMRFLAHFHNILIYVLIASAIITALLGHAIDTAVIMAVVIANAIIGFIQEGKAEKAMEAISKMLAPKASVIRDGERHSINGEELVTGDIVILEAGDKVPADARIISCNNLQIQEAILTGESIAVEKRAEPVDEACPLGERFSMAFSGTLVTSGQGKAVVVATGKNTEIGRISDMLSEVETLTTPLVQQMSSFAKWLTIFILLISATLLLYGYFVAHREFTEMFMAVVGLSVAAIPEGLPAVLTITLAVGVQQMARRNAIVRRLPAIETLGAVSVICTDKTGTLTRNEMMVTTIVTEQNHFTVEGNGYEPEGSIKLEDTPIDPDEHSAIGEIALTAILCNDANLIKTDNIWKIEGDPMEGALLTLAEKSGLNIREEQEKWRRTDIIPFDAKHRFMATLNHDHEHHAFIFVKGAPEQILSMCKNQRSNDPKEKPIDKAYWQKKADEIANKGQRVLALAVKKVQPEHTVLELSDVDNSLTLIGLVGLIDPPREEAIAAVAECLNASIQVKMITGDHAKTALAISKQIGLRNTDTVLTGTEIDNMRDEELKEAALKCDVFARTSPEHKLRLVMSLQSHGLTVAMTGDGVNDAPALKRADAGIAMGKNGSEVAKEAAELVLADDNFASIAAAVKEGRTVYDNIKKVISWTLPTNAGEALTIIVALFLGATLPITPIQILWVNLITATTLGLALAFEPTEDRTMHIPPRPRNEPLLDASLVWHMILVSFLFLCGVYGMYFYAIGKGYSEELARTIVVNTLVVMEIFHLFFIRNIYGTSLTWKAVKGTKVVWLTVIIVTVAQFAVTYLPPLQQIFATEPVSIPDGILIIAVGVVLFTIIEIEKQIRLSLRNML